MGQMGPMGAPLAAAAMSVPIAALAVPGEDDAMSTPTAGDRVSYQVDGVVESLDGETAQVRATAINGTPIPGGEEMAPETDPLREQMLSAMGATGETEEEGL